MKTLHTIYTSFAKRLAMSFIVLMTIGVGSIMAAEETIDTSKATFASSKHTYSQTSCTVVQSQGNSTSAVNSSYPNRWYKGHDVKFTPKSGYTITKIVLVGSENDYNGQSMTASTGELSKNSNTTTWTGSITSSSSLTLRMGKQFRFGSVTITYTAATTHTVTIQSSNVSYGTVYPESINNVANNTAISANGNTLTVGTTTVTATPKEQDANYTYAFSNWSGIPVGGKVTADVTVTANFTSTARALTNYRTTCTEPSTFTVTFNANGHGTAPDEQIVASGQQATEPTPAPTATGYTFGGWYKEPECENEFDFNTAITERITLYAKWTAIQTTITLNANGGSGNTTSVAATYDSSTLNPSSITNPTKTGHTFGGWYSGEGGTGSLVINSSGKLQANVSGFTGINGVWKATTNKTLYAKWTPAVYTINYKDQGNVDFSGQHEAGYPQNHTYNTETTLKSASKEHYTFGGWYKESDCSGTEVTTLGATEYTDNITLYAKWTAKTYTITLDANGGTFVDNRDSQTKGSATFDYIYGTYATYNDAPNLTEYYSDLKRDGYQFDKWVSAGSPWNKLFTSTGDRTIQAQWSKLYTITLSENGTTTTPITQTSTSYTLPTELAAGSCQEDTKELVGWSTVAIPTPGDKPASNFYELGETVTLTADQTTFYAVFATAEGSQNVFKRMQTLDELNSASKIAIINAYSSSTYILNTSLTSEATPPNESNGKITVTEGQYWTLEKSNSYWKFKNSDNKYLTTNTIPTSSSKYGSVRLATSGNNEWVIANNTCTSNGTPVFTIYNATSTTAGLEYSNGWILYYSTDFNTSWFTLKLYIPDVAYSDYTTTCVKLPDPVLTFATEPANPIVFGTVACGGNSSKQSVTVVGENLRDVVEVSVTGPYKIARTSSAALKDFTTSLTLDKTAEGAIHSNYKTVYIISTPPAQSTEATTGTLTFTTTKGNTLTVNLSTPTVTCTQYTLTLVDRGVSTEQPTKYYAGETIDEAPADPEGVCTDPIHYVFDGWADATVAEGSTTYTKVTFPYTVEGNTKFYAVYRYLEGGGNGDYNLVTSALDDWSGDYLIAYSNTIFADGQVGGKDALGAIGAEGIKVDLSQYISNNTIPATEGDKYNVTLETVTGGYVLKTKDGKYNYHTNNTENGISASTKNTADDYPITVKFVSEEEINLCLGGSAIGSVFRYNAQGFFRFYKNGGQQPVYLYKKADGTTYYTTSPVCGPHLAITEGKDIYVTGGNAGGTRDLVIAQQKVSYKATRLNVGPTSQVPDVKVATNGITVGGVVTSDVKVTIDQTKEQQTDGTYTITGDIVVTYEPRINGVYENIDVKLAVDYNTDATDNFTVHARSLPAEFVIVAKSGDKWYALNGDMNTNAANPANGQVTLNDLDNPTEATYAPCNAIYTFEAMPQDAEDRISVRFIGQDNKYLWAASGTNTGIQNNSTNPAADALAYNWKLYTQDNITYRFGNANSSRQLTLSGEKFGMYASGVQDIRILPYVEKCLYNYAPSNLKVSVLKGTYVTLTWDAVVGATKYQYSTDATSWTDAGTEPTVTINDLTGATEYTYYIRAYHKDAGVSQECIDYAEITFTTANCNDVPTDITYSADMNSIIVSWIADAATSTVNLYSDEEAEVLVATQSVASPCTFTDLAKNTQYYVQILANGTCASPIIPVKTEDVEVDIVEWKRDSIIVDINTDETIGVTLENEVSYGSGLGSLAEDLFFSKYFEGSGSLKMIAIYNGTGKDVDLSEYRIDRGSNGDATNISKTYDLSQLGIIKQGQEIIFYSWPLISESSYSCSQSFLDSKVQESGLDANPRWILCDAKTHNGIEFEAMDFSGNDPLLLYKSSELIDVFGVSTEQESPASTQICSGRSDQAWSADGVTNMDYGKTTEDFPNGEIPYGVNVDDETITAYTARVIMFRKNTVVSGKNAVTKNTTTFATFAEEWEARQVCMSGDDGDLTCAAYHELGTFDYSDYYTKYESMNQDQEFDENDRNPDGTVSIYIPDLYKHACSNIRVKLTNSNSEVLTDREYKVPIMITTTQGTDGQTFLDLQQNLATKEVDGGGNVIATHPLSLEEVREICKTCDVVVRDNATLTKVTDGTTNDHPQVHDVIVYEGASIVIPDGINHNYTINSLSLRRKGDKVASAQVQGTGKFVLPADVPVTLSMRIDANNWHWFTLPYDCDIADVTWSDGTPAKYNTDWFLMYYDGESRAASTNPHDNHWKVYNGTTIEAGKGYIIGITGDLAHPNYTFELRFPMAQEVLTDEQKNKTVALNAWGVKSDNTPNNKGWNLVGNPYLNYYKTADEYSLDGLPLIHYIDTDPVTGEWNYENSGSVPYVVTPIDGGWYEYQQELASEVNMMPFTAYFVQVGDPNTHENGQALNASFEASNRGKKSILRRAHSEVDDLEEPAIVAVSLTNAKGESDKTTLLIANHFTNEYEMNADFFKWFGDYYTYYTKPVLYTLGADNESRAFNALNEELAAQPVALGMYAAQAGEYTFSLYQRSELSRVEEVWLHDATSDTHTNLMLENYTFSTNQTDGSGRFSLSVKMMPKIATSIDNIEPGTIWATAKDNEVIVNGLNSGLQLWLYDAVGKLLYAEPTTNYQHRYTVPQDGVYFITVKDVAQVRTIKVVVE